MTETTNAAAPPPAWAVAMKDGPPPDAATPAWAVALTADEAERAAAPWRFHQWPYPINAKRPGTVPTGPGVRELQKESFRAMNLATFAAERKPPRSPAHIPEPQPTPDPRAALLGLAPLPLAEVGPVLAAIGVARHVAQDALNDALKAGEVRLACQDGTVLVVAGAVP